jgi:hypothetical protein
MKWNWGFGVAATYIVFAIATSGFVVFAMSRPVSLVRPDYYAESLREDQQLAARANATRLGAAVSVAVQDRTLRIRVPRPLETTITGTVVLYRASDPDADRTFTFVPDPNGVQTIDLSRSPSGHWIVKLHWTTAGRDYYVEEPVVLR